MSLRGSLEAEVHDEGVTLEYHVENGGDEVIALTFRTGQRYDIQVIPEGDTQPVWRASDGRMYTMAIEHHTLEPGEGWTFEETVTALAGGTYEAHADLAAEEVSAPAQTAFTVE